VSARNLCEAGCGYLVLDSGEWRIVATERAPGTDEMDPRDICHDCSVRLLESFTGLRIQIDVRCSAEDVQYMLARLRRSAAEDDAGDPDADADILSS
jgi:hypothetical protein